LVELTCSPSILSLSGQPLSTHFSKSSLILASSRLGKADVGPATDAATSIQEAVEA
jgi:hypothetical protein